MTKVLDLVYLGITPCHDPLPVEILHAAQELQASEKDVAEVIIITKLKLNFA